MSGARKLISKCFNKVIWLEDLVSEINNRSFEVDVEWVKSWLNSKLLVELSLLERKPLVFGHF